MKTNGRSFAIRFLLDTHIWLWLLRDPSKIRPGTSGQLKDADNELWLSPISTWEAVTLHFKKRVYLGEDLKQWLMRATSGTHEAPMTHEIAVAARQLVLHQDPADRILVATAQVLDLVFVTSDSKLLGLPNIRTLANR